MIIDTHCHLISEGVEKEKILANLEADGLERIVNIGTDVNDSRAGVEVANQNARVFTTVGIHPEYAGEVTDADLDEIDRLASEKKVVAIGEIGLDYHYETNNKEKQKEVFEKQITIAKKHGLPICIHTRDASEDTYQILKNRRADIVDCIIHCFSDTREYLEKFLALGFYISFSGNITFKKRDRSFIKDIPLDKILVETDSPYLSPEPFRGQKNEPSRVKYVALKLADEYQMSYEEFTKHTNENSYNVYKKMR